LRCHPVTPQVNAIKRQSIVQSELEGSDKSDNATKNMLNAAQIGRRTANGPKAQLKRTITQRQNAIAQHAWKPSDQPAWLTEKFYAEKIQPLLASLSASAIARHISVSPWYAGRLREGYRPHPRHWRALAELVGVSANGPRCLGRSSQHSQT
jgi:hypothetical protein